MNLNANNEENVSFDTIKQTMENAFAQMQLLESGRESKYEGWAKPERKSVDTSSRVVMDGSLD